MTTRLPAPKRRRRFFDFIHEALDPLYKTRFVQKACWQYRRTVHRMQRFDHRTGLLSSGIPLFIIMASSTAVMTLMMDRQFELRDLRVRSIGQREMALQEEHDNLMRFLSETDDIHTVDNSVPLPRQEPRI
mmetsp:Transcript_22876/g.45065  ORF Transcript_22876/g.45065 Transcript_22876/m.45065 type:complete len:131 (+) Transcript_22876:83-475(+)